MVSVSESAPVPEPGPGPLAASAQRLAATLDSLGGADWAAPSLLPGWSRAAVVAHLALNGEAFVRVLTGARHGEPSPMYASSAARDADIAALATEPGPAIRDRLEDAEAAILALLPTLPDEAWAGGFPRAPGDADRPTRGVPTMRWRELEIHHADLGCAYGPASWPADFALDLLEARLADGVPATLVATDLGRTWTSDGPTTVRGTAADLAWWLTGRAPSPSLVADGGHLPEIGAW